MTAIDEDDHQLKCQQVANTFLQRFFSAPNRITLTPAPAGPLSAPILEALRPAIDRFRAGRWDRAVLLPMMVGNETCVTWAAIAYDERSQRSLTAELDAFLGRTYVERPSMDANDVAIEAIRTAAAGTPLKCHVLRSNKSASNDKVATIWRKRWELWDWQVSRPTLEIRGFAQLRAAFDRALLARNEPQARAAMLALQQAHGLSAENRAFLEVRMAAAFGRWADIVGHRQWPQLLQVRLPPETFGDLWEALYEVYLRPVEVRGPLSALLQTFERDIRVTAGPLLRALGTSQRPAAIKAFVLHELAQSQPSHGLLNALLARLPPGAFGAASQDVDDAVRALRPRATLDVALEDIDRERYEQAYVALHELDDSPTVLTALLRCAREIEDPIKAAHVLARVTASAYAQEVRDSRPKLHAAVSALAQRTVSAAQAVVGPAPDAPLDRLAPAASVSPPATGSEAPVSAANDAADLLTWWRETARSEETSLLGDPGLLDRLVDEIETRALSDDRWFDMLLPVWFEWIVDRTPPRSQLLRVYRAVIEGLFARNQLGESELEMIRRAAGHYLQAGPKPSEYAWLVDQLIAVFDLVRSPRAIDWAIDIADQLAVWSCRDPEARLRWVNVLFDACRRDRGRLTPAQRGLVRWLAAELQVDIADEFDETRSPDPAEEVTSARVLLYSLDPNATHRASSVLQTLLPGCKFVTRDDKACSRGLEAAVRGSDLTVFVSAVASHAAFFCIKDALPSTDRLIHVQGSGTTRIVQAVLARLEMPAPVH